MEFNYSQIIKGHLLREHHLGNDTQFQEIRLEHIDLSLRKSNPVWILFRSNSLLFKIKKFERFDWKFFKFGTKSFVNFGASVLNLNCFEVEHIKAWSPRLVRIRSHRSCLNSPIHKNPNACIAMPTGVSRCYWKYLMKYLITFFT